DMWNRNVKPLIGETKVFVYPYGAFTYYGTEKHDLLVENGFVMFCGTSQLNTVWNNKHPKNGGVASGTGSIYLERFTLTGQTLRMYGSKASFIDYYVNVLGQSQDAALKAYNKRYAEYRKNMEEYCIPENTYDHDNRYYKILPDT
ncbi:MAG: hypothetical protein IJ344_06120, partial [Clostridia bacterium]|nr:hypothetical protein [Clostridia bacterium]